MILLPYYTDKGHRTLNHLLKNPFSHVTLSHKFNIFVAPSLLERAMILMIVN